MSQFNQPPAPTTPQQPNNVRFDNPNEQPADITLSDDGDGKGGIGQKVGGIVGAIVVVALSFILSSASEKGDMSDNARDIVETELAEIEAAHPSVYAANEAYLESILDDVHEEAFEGVFEQSGSADDFNPNAYFEWVFEELIAQAEADQKWELADALYEEYEPFEKGHFAFEVNWQPF